MSSNDILVGSNARMEGLSRLIPDTLNDKEKIKKKHSELLNNSFSGNGLNQVKNHSSSYEFLKWHPYRSGTDLVKA